MGNTPTYSHDDCVCVCVCVCVTVCVTVCVLVCGLQCGLVQEMGQVRLVCGEYSNVYIAMMIVFCCCFCFLFFLCVCVIVSLCVCVWCVCVCVCVTVLSVCTTYTCHTHTVQVCLYCHSIVLPPPLLPFPSPTHTTSDYRGEVRCKCRPLVEREGKLYCIDNSLGLSTT